MRTFILIIIVLFSLKSFAQNKQVLYNFAGLPQTLMLNPGAEVENKFYIGFPLFSQVSLHGGFSGFSAYDVFADDGIDINTKIDDVVNKFGKSEFFELTQQLEVISAGFGLNKTTYVSFGYYQESNALVKTPRDLIDLAYEGNTDVNRNYAISKLTARAELLGVYHVGISKKITDKWQVGGRFKLYSGVLNASSKGNKGALVTNKGVDNLYQQELENVDVLIQTSGIVLDDYDNVEPSDYIKKLFFSGNYGVGVDLGFTYHFKKQWTLSGSAQDIGFIYYTKDVESYTVKGDFKVDGFNLGFDLENPEDYWNDLKDRFEEDVVVDTLNTNYISTRPMKLNGAIDYSFGKEYDDCRFETRPGKYSNKVGVQLFSAVGSVHSYVAATLFYERWFSKHFQAKVSYTADAYSFSNLGAGISTQFGPFNLYLLADNLLYLNNLYNTKSTSIQVGINFIFYNK
ncbi:hypothetical protein SAMN06265371_103204 [Lutibacter agarilyticus]|uniref:DUF5723 domain-containing protein n=1 Tax=Lutibacter agarilyticus TaxID=1109740 RepID=A0A238WHC6_9FLAO|nr:DUF5723 family protein [Lutibacter agarilyticus]SNR45733.1 hypothetical protein SAMN06265371_103204 [Lutibacter agarilyticus]